MVVGTLKSFAGGTIKADLDLELAIDMLSLVERCDKYILCSGDGDFVPLVVLLPSAGCESGFVHTASRCLLSATLKQQTTVDATDKFKELYELLPLARASRQSQVKLGNIFIPGYKVV